MKHFIGFYNKSVILTYVGAVAAVVGIALSLLGNLKFALLCLVVCGVSDVFDGMIARRCKRSEDEKSFGIQIDSLTDMVSFAVFPVVISFALGNTAWYHIAACSLYILSAITRLGYFNAVTATGENKGVYLGLPVTFSSLITVFAYLLGRTLGIADILVFVGLLIMSLLFVLKFNFKKPSGIMYVFIGLLAVVMAVGVIILG